MAGSDSGWEDLKQLGQWAYQKARSRPIGQIEETMRTGKPPQKRMESPVPSNPQRAKPKKRIKSVSKGRR